MAAHNFEFKVLGLKQPSGNSLLQYSVNNSEKNPKTHINHPLSQESFVLKTEHGFYHSPPEATQASSWFKKSRKIRHLTSWFSSRKNVLVVSGNPLKIMGKLGKSEIILLNSAMFWRKTWGEILVRDLYFSIHNIG